MIFDRHLTVPFEMIQFCYENNFGNPLLVYLYLKSISNGIVNEKNICFKELSNKTGIKDKRTIRKYLGILLDINWIGFNSDSKNYFIRSFKRIRRSYDFNKRTGVIFEMVYISKFKGFVEGAIICHKLKRQEFARKAKIRRKAGQAALIKGGALQANQPIEGVSEYVGMSNFRLSRLLCCSMSHANRAKIWAEKHGYLKTVKSFEVLAENTTPDYNIRHFISDSHKTRFRVKKRKGVKHYQLVRQKYDEIIPKLVFKRIQKV